MAKAVYPGGCYECEEEVWEEVPCDDIPSNSTTISPPLPCYFTTTPTPPTTTVTNPITTTMPTTTTPATTTPTTTTTPITTMPITTTTTPSPTTTTPKDPYNKCYCECKVGCKEFCRKIVVNPDPKIQVVQVSKITAPKAQGPIEYTHYHQRELLQKPHYDKNYESYSDVDTQMSVSDEITDNNSSSNKYLTSTQAPPTSPATCYKKPIVMEPRRSYASANKKHSYNNYPPKPKTSVYTKPRTTPAPSYPVYENSYARAEAGFNHPYSPQSKPQPPTKYYTDPASYDFPVPLEKIYTKVTKTIHGPPDNTGLRYTDLTPSHSNTNCQSFGHSQPTYSPPTSLKDSSVNSNVYVSDSLSYDDSFNTLINEFLESNPSNPAPYEAYSSPFYSVSYSR